DTTPFERIVDTATPHRDPSRNPLTEAMIVLDNTPEHPPSLPGLEVTEESLVSDKVSHDLSVDFVQGQDGLAAVLGYSTALFDRETIERMAEHLEELLVNLAATPNRPLTTVPMLREAERRLVVEQWNDTAREIPPTSIVEAFDQQVRRTPDAVAVVCGSTRLTYRELGARATALAHHLTGRTGETLVALACGRSADTVVGMLGVLKAGGTYLPIDTGNPDSRLKYLLGESAPALVLTVDTGTRTRLRSLTDAPVQLLDEVESPGETGTLPSIRPESAAYVLYTSGSTGKPKGVVVEHRNLTALFTHHRAELYGPERTSAGKRLSVALTAEWSFDASLNAILMMIDGDELHIVDDDVRRDPDLFLDHLVRNGIDVLCLTPSYTRHLVESGITGMGAHTPKVLLVGGEAIDEELWQTLRALPATHVYNLYGPTECTVETVLCRLDESDVPVIGRPMWNTRALVLDDALRPAPIGVGGELYLAGAQISRGYLNQRLLTAERFVADPFSTKGERLYRTGDLARWRAGGTLEYLGRADQQVKVRGFRVELGEIERVLAKHTGSGQVAAVLREDRAGSPQVVAYVAGTSLTAEELRATLALELPAYLLPSMFVVLETLPLTDNGKIDRAALPVPEISAELAEAYLPPRTPVEATLAEVWAETLGVERVGVSDNFFLIGGDSILSIQLVSKARQAGLRMAAKDLFLAPTIGQLATLVSTGEPREAAPVRPVTGPLPLTPVQRDHFARDPIAPWQFSQSVLVELAGDVETGALRTALSALVSHHDALRTRFTAADGEWSATIAEDEHADVLETHALTDGDESARWAALRERAVLADQSFDLGAGLLLHAVLFNGVGNPLLFLSAHHLVVDAVSWRILLDDLDTAYHQALAGEPIDLGAKTSPVRDWAEGLVRHVGDGALDGQLPYWSALPEVAPLPVDHPGPNLVATARSLSLSLPERETDALVRVAPSALRIPVQDLLLIALAVAVSRWANDDRAAIDVEGHGREGLLDELDLTRTVGWFTEIHPVVLDVPDADWPALVKSARRQLRAVPGRGIGYSALRRLSRPGSPAAALTARRQPQVAFNYHGRMDGLAGDGNGLYHRFRTPVGQEQSPDERMAYLVEFVGAVRGDVLEFELHYSAASHDEGTIAKLADAFGDALRSLAEHADPSVKG
ncbi:amino acid adenylation domain-containing protein, partial [Amycolatopsis minnesotensis]|uniref:amino acid adenylation domain-containing protein n=1 Tax=Amycolatopsis minnesotensis TaxID=337894 RepID=UPI0031D296AE